ncbi:MAG: Holliday junction resolvase RuvX [Legionella sp.]|jgi:putative Holliday junction resolvase
MPSEVYLGFDFGYKRIGLAVGQRLTGSATPLPTLNAKLGIPDWELVAKIITQWKPQALVVGVPTCIDDSELYTTKAAQRFAKQLKKRFALDVHLVDERLTTVEARAHLFEQGGYRKMKKTQVDGIAACIILEQWLHHP